MVIDFQIDGKTDIVVNIPERDIPYWVAAYRLIGIKVEPVHSPMLKPSIEMPFDGTHSPTRFNDDD